MKVRAVLFLLAVCAVSGPAGARAAVFGVPNGATNPNGWFLLTGSGSSNADGDAVHQMTFKIEVTGVTLDVQVFDAGNSGARDWDRGSASTTTYTLRDPLGAVVATTAVGNDNATTQNTLARLTAAGFAAPGASAAIAVQPGLYELQVSMSGNTEVNAFGLSVATYAVYTSTDVPAGAEDGQIIFGAMSSGGAPVANITQPVTAYPYVDHGCQLTTTNFDMDTGAGNGGAGSSGTLLSRLGTSTGLTMSGATVASDNNVNPTQAATKAQDYGIWTLTNNIGTQQNLVDWRIADDAGVNIPGANLPHRPNAPLRIYLPASGTLPGAPVAPLEPRLEQSLTPLAGPNPPVALSTSTYEVNILLTNPTANAMTGITLTANVPGGEVLYESSNPPLVTAGAQVTGGGTVTSQPADGGSGNVVATWANVGAGASVALTYFVAVTPAGAGAVNVTAAYTSGNGTRLTYTPAFSSVGFPRTENLGALCEMRVQAATAVPNAVALTALSAEGYADRVNVRWSTGAEWNNLGFNVYRAEGATGIFAQVNRALILGAGTTSLAADYLFVDPGVRDGASYSYLLEDIERTGKRTLHGPVTVTAGGGAAPPIDFARYQRVAGPDGELSAPILALLDGGSDPDAPSSTASSTPSAPTGAAPSIAPDPGRSIARVLSSDAEGMLIEIRIPTVALSGATLDGVFYTDVAIPGFSRIAQPGHPALPELGIPIAIPDVADVRLEIESVREKTFRGAFRPSPAPTYTQQADGSLEASFTPDPEIYGGSGDYPAAPLALGGSVRLGEERLLVLRLDPVRWSPAGGALAQATRIRARLHFEGAHASDAASTPDAKRVNQFWLASRGALKLGVATTGIHRISGQALLDAGLDAGTDPRRLALYTGGREVAVAMSGEVDGVLDPDDALIFWGEALDNAHALARTYWLAAGNLAGLRMAVAGGAPTGSDSGESTTPARVRLEKNLTYVPFVLNGETSNFVGDSIFQTPRDQSVTLAGVSGGPGALTLRVQGATADSNVDLDHHLSVAVNGVLLGDARWDGFGVFEGLFPIPAGVLVEGANQVRLTPIADTGAAFDFDYVDWVEIAHDRMLATTGEALAFETSVVGDHLLSNVVGTDPVLLDITDPAAPVWIAGGPFEGGVLRFAAPAGLRRMAVATSEGMVAPASIVRDAPSALHESPGTDWLAIAHGSLVEGTQPLAALRAGEGLRARVVDVQDVYDEFGFGDPDPAAIRDYLAWQYANGGTPRLGYALLVGDASFDERDYTHGPNRNLVLTKLLDGTFTERASDNWFASFLGDDAVPDVALGRLPVKDAAQLAVVAGKIAAYAAQPLGQAWQSSALFVADDGFRAFDAAEAARFEAASAAMARWLPSGFDGISLFLSAIPEAEQQAVARQAIVDALNAGQLFVSYLGHGAITLWADEVIFRASDLALIQNADRLPFVVVLNCLNGYFAAPLGDALGESLLFKSDGGAMGVFAPTSVSPIEGQDVMAEAIARALFRQGALRVGDALMRARAAMVGLTYFDDLSNSWVLLGDPAARLAYVAAPIADAGGDVEVAVKARVMLDGTASGGVPGPLRYAWRLVSAPAGAHADLWDASSARPTVRVNRPGGYVFELVVSAEGVSSAPDQVTVRALASTTPGGGGGL